MLVVYSLQEELPPPTSLSDDKFNFELYNYNIIKWLFSSRSWPLLPSLASHFVPQIVTIPRQLQLPKSGTPSMSRFPPPSPTSGPTGSLLSQGRTAPSTPSTTSTSRPSTLTCRGSTSTSLMPLCQAPQSPNALSSRPR